MLTIKLQLTDETRRTVSRKGTIRNVGTVRAPKLACELSLANGQPPVTSICEMPLAWELPVPHVAVHCLATTLARDRSPRMDVRKSLGTIEVTVMGYGRTLASHIAWRIYDDIQDDIGDWEPLGRKAVTAWQLAMMSLQRLMQPRSSVALTPMPPIHLDSQRPYCRVGELPEALQARFWEIHCLLPQPLVRGIIDAVHPSDVAKFLALHG